MKLRLMLGSAALASAVTIVQGGLTAQAPAPAQPQAPAPAQGQGRGAGRGAAPAAQQSGQQAALIDLTGYWVSVVDEDWRFRMMTPPKGDYAQVPMAPAARPIADTFDPA